MHGATKKKIFSVCLVPCLKKAGHGPIEASVLTAPIVSGISFGLFILRFIVTVKECWGQ